MEEVTSSRQGRDNTGTEERERRDEWEATKLDLAAQRHTELLSPLDQFMAEVKVSRQETEELLQELKVSCQETESLRWNASIFDRELETIKFEFRDLKSG